MIKGDRMYPIWLRVYLPKNILIIIPIYLLIITLILFIYSKKNSLLFKDVIKKYLPKLFLITFTINLFSSLLLFIIGLIFNIDIINKLSFASFIIMILTFFLIFMLTNKIIKKNVSIIISIIFIPYLLLLPLNISDYKNTLLDNTNNVSTIINLLKIDKKEFSIKGNALTINLNNNMSYKNLEKNASIMFNLIEVDKIFFIKDKIYSFYLNDINKIYDVKNISIKDINNRYNFKNDGIYMGHINNYDIFDESISCEEKIELLIDNYYINCSSINDLYLYNQKEKVALKDKIKELNIEDLLKTNLNIIKK